MQSYFHLYLKNPHILINKGNGRARKAFNTPIKNVQKDIFSGNDHPNV